MTFIEPGGFFDEGPFFRGDDPLPPIPEGPDTSEDINWVFDNLSPLSWLLDAVSLPSALISGVGREVAGLVARGEIPNPIDVASHVGQLKGWGDVFEEFDVLQDPDERWFGRLLGFAGDVGLDPLSWFGAAGARYFAQGGRKVAASLAVGRIDHAFDYARMSGLDDVKTIEREWALYGSTERNYSKALNAHIQKPHDVKRATEFENAYQKFRTARRNAEEYTTRIGAQQIVDDGIKLMGSRRGGTAALKDDNLADVFVATPNEREKWGLASGLRFRWNIGLGDRFTLGGPQILTQEQWSNVTAPFRRARGWVADRFRPAEGSWRGRAFESPLSRHVRDVINDETLSSRASVTKIAAFEASDQWRNRSVGLHVRWSKRINDIREETGTLTDDESKLLEEILEDPKNQSVTGIEVPDDRMEVLQEANRKIREVLREMEATHVNAGLIEDGWGDVYLAIQYSRYADAPDELGNAIQTRILHARNLFTHYLGYELPSMTKALQKGLLEVVPGFEGYPSKPLRLPANGNKSDVPWAEHREDIRNVYRAVAEAEGEPYVDPFISGPFKILTTYIRESGRIHSAKWQQYGLELHGWGMAAHGYSVALKIIDLIEKLDLPGDSPAAKLAGYREAMEALARSLFENSERFDHAGLGGLKPETATAEQISQLADNMQVTEDLINAVDRGLSELAEQLEGVDAAAVGHLRDEVRRIANQGPKLVDEPEIADNLRKLQSDVARLNPDELLREAQTSTENIDDALAQLEITINDTEPLKAALSDYWNVVHDITDNVFESAETAFEALVGRLDGVTIDEGNIHGILKDITRSVDRTLVSMRNVYNALQAAQQRIGDANPSLETIAHHFLTSERSLLGAMKQEAERWRRLLQWKQRITGPDPANYVATLTDEMISVGLNEGVEIMAHEHVDMLRYQAVTSIVDGLRRRDMSGVQSMSRVEELRIAARDLDRHGRDKNAGRRFPQIVALEEQAATLFSRITSLLVGRFNATKDNVANIYHHGKERRSGRKVTDNLDGDGLQRALFNAFDSEVNRAGDDALLMKIDEHLSQLSAIMHARNLVGHRVRTAYANQLDELFELAVAGSEEIRAARRRSVEVAYGDQLDEVLDDVFAPTSTDEMREMLLRRVDDSDDTSDFLYDVKPQPGEWQVRGPYRPQGDVWPGVPEPDDQLDSLLGIHHNPLPMFDKMLGKGNTARAATDALNALGESRRRYWQLEMESTPYRNPFDLAVVARDYAETMRRFNRQMSDILRGAMPAVPAPLRDRAWFERVLRAMVDDPRFAHHPDPIPTDVSPENLDAVRAWLLKGTNYLPRYADGVEQPDFLDELMDEWGMPKHFERKDGTPYPKPASDLYDLAMEHGRRFGINFKSRLRETPRPVTDEDVEQATRLRMASLMNEVSDLRTRVRENADKPDVVAEVGEQLDQRVREMERGGENVRLRVEAEAWLKQRVDASPDFDAATQIAMKPDAIPDREVQDVLSEIREVDAELEQLRNANRRPSEYDVEAAKRIARRSRDMLQEEARGLIKEMEDLPGFEDDKAALEEALDASLWDPRGAALPLDTTLDAFDFEMFNEVRDWEDSIEALRIDIDELGRQIDELLEPLDARDLEAPDVTGPVDGDTVSEVMWRFEQIAEREAAIDVLMESAPDFKLRSGYLKRRNRRRRSVYGRERMADAEQRILDMRNNVEREEGLFREQQVTLWNTLESHGLPWRPLTRRFREVRSPEERAATDLSVMSGGYGADVPPRAGAPPGGAAPPVAGDVADLGDARDTLADEIASENIVLPEEAGDEGARLLAVSRSAPEEYQIDEETLNEMDKAAAAADDEVAEAAAWQARSMFEFVDDAQRLDDPRFAPEDDNAVSPAWMFDRERTDSIMYERRLGGRPWMVRHAQERGSSIPPYWWELFDGHVAFGDRAEIIAAFARAEELADRVAWYRSQLINLYEERSSLRTNYRMSRREPGPKAWARYLRAARHGEQRGREPDELLGSDFWLTSPERGEEQLSALGVDMFGSTIEENELRDLFWERTTRASTGLTEMQRRYRDLRLRRAQLEQELVAAKQSEESRATPLYATQRRDKLDLRDPLGDEAHDFATRIVMGALQQVKRSSFDVNISDAYFALKQWKEPEAPIEGLEGILNPATGNPQPEALDPLSPQHEAWSESFGGPSWFKRLYADDRSLAASNAADNQRRIEELEELEAVQAFSVFEEDWKLLTDELDLRRQARNIIEQGDEVAARIEAGEQPMLQNLIDQFVNSTINEAELRRFAVSKGQYELLMENIAEAADQELLDIQRVFNDVELASLIHRQIGGKLREWNELGLMTDPETAEVLDSLYRLEAPGHVAQFLDRVVSGWRGLSLLTPGFHTRNAYGILFVNMMADVTVKQHVDVGKVVNRIWRTERKGKTFRPRNKLERFVWDMTRTEYAVGLGFTGTHIQDLSKLDQTWNPSAIFSKERLWTPFAVNRKIGAPIEQIGRLAAGWSVADTMGSLHSWDEVLSRATRKIHSLHFDYANLSKLEAGTLRNIIPFWTWISRNVVLTARMLAMRPQLALTVERFYENVGGGTPRNPFIPFYFDTNQYEQITPQVWSTLELPYKSALADVGQATDLRNPFAAAVNVTPWGRTLIEGITGTDVAHGYQIPNSERAKRFLADSVPIVNQATRIIPGFPGQTRGQRDRLPESLKGVLGLPWRSPTRAEQVREYQASHGSGDPREPSISYVDAEAEIVDWLASVR